MADDLKKRIEELEEKNRYIADNLIDAIWVIDTKTLQYDFVTPSIERISGYSPEEITQMTMEEKLTPESFAKLTEIISTETKRHNQGVKSIMTMELEFLHKNGTSYWVEVRAKFYKKSAEPLKLIGISREITDRKKTERETQDLVKQLGEALAEKERLLEENKILRGLLPICSGCRRIRDKDGRWWPLDAYVEKRTPAQLTHTICPDCKVVFYEDQD